jgi:hypothetical protein
MPYASDAQRRFFHSAGAAKAGITAKDVAEWDNASRGKKLPKRKRKSRKQQRRFERSSQGR